MEIILKFFPINLSVTDEIINLSVTNEIINLSVTNEIIKITLSNTGLQGAKGEPGLGFSYFPSGW